VQRSDYREQRILFRISAATATRTEVTVVSRQWTVLHIFGSAHIPPWQAVAKAVGRLRTADADALWAFDRPPGRHGPHVRVSWYTMPDLAAALTGDLRTTAGDHGWDVITGTHDTQRSKYLDADMAAAATRLADVSSDLALKVACARPPVDETALAVAHLARLTDLVDESARAAFLFHCWEHWSQELSPAHRREIAVRAATQTLDDATVNELTRSPEWERYLAAVKAVAIGRYLLFDHAHLTHQRLGISPAAEAFAARVVRIGLTASRRELQPV
jgi:hypothetical protein